MTVYYNAELAAGFIVKVKDLDKFKKLVPAVTHEEPRFSQTSGKPLEPEVVVDEDEYEVYVLNGKEIEEVNFAIEDFGNAVAELLKCEFHCMHHMAGDLDYVVFGVPVKDIGKTYEGSRIDSDPHMDLQDIFKKKAKFTRLAAGLKKLGIKFKGPVIAHIVYAS